MFINGKPFAKLNLADTKQLQQFRFDPRDWTKFKNVPLTLDFKILDVYSGGRDQNTAITEIYIKGLSVGE